ncbi:MAG: NADH-quinone oxidoreductase subunit C [Candidatus Omnitrophota bacterium]
MKRQEIIENIKVRAGKDILDFQDRSKNRIYFTVSNPALVPLVKYLYNDAGARFITASGVDTRKAIEILYHFSIDETGLIVSLRVILAKPEPETETLTGVMKGAEWIEMEIHEMLGVNFKGHPNLRHLLLKEDWPKGNYPLRRDR